MLIMKNPKEEGKDHGYELLRGYETNERTNEITPKSGAHIHYGRNGNEYDLTNDNDTYIYTQPIQTYNHSTQHSLLAYFPFLFSVGGFIQQNFATYTTFLFCFLRLAPFLRIS